MYNLVLQNIEVQRINEFLTEFMTFILLHFSICLMVSEIQTNDLKPVQLIILLNEQMIK